MVGLFLMGLGETAGYGAGTAGLGGPHVTNSVGEAVLVNPAALEGTRIDLTAASDASVIPSVIYESTLGFSTQFFSFNAGIAIFYRGVVDNGQVIFSEYAGSLGLNKKFKRLKIGLAVKYIGWQTSYSEKLSGGGITIDAGILYNASQAIFGLAARNCTKPRIDSGKGTVEYMPVELAAGLCLPYESAGLEGFLDAIYREGSDSVLIEIGILKTLGNFTLKAGYQGFNLVESPNLGVGISFSMGRFILNYSLLYKTSIGGLGQHYIGGTYKL